MNAVSSLQESNVNIVILSSISISNFWSSTWSSTAPFSLATPLGFRLQQNALIKYGVSVKGVASLQCTAALPISWLVVRQSSHGNEKQSRHEEGFVSFETLVVELHETGMDSNEKWWRRMVGTHGGDNRKDVVNFRPYSVVVRKPGYFLASEIGV